MKSGGLIHNSQKRRTKVMKNEVNNIVKVTGEVTEDFTLSHSVFGEGFYRTYLKVPRTSENYDVIPIIISDRLIDVSFNLAGGLLEVTGQLRSFNNHTGGGSKLVLSIFALEAHLLDTDEPFRNENDVILNGFICKEPIYRTTPLGREIADILVAVNRSYGKSDYIPCITWGRNARYAADLAVGSNIVIQGRFQSRQYSKKISETESELRTAYEASVSKIELL